MTPEIVTKPKHYNVHPSQVECIDISEQLGFNLGNAFKYLFRREVKHESPVVDLQKALWYVEREIRNVKESLGETGTVAVGPLAAPVTGEFGLYFFDKLFWQPLAEKALQVLAYEKGWILGAMAYIIRGSEHHDEIDLEIAAYYIRQEIAERS